MVAPALRMSFVDADALAHELETNLQHGRAFVQGAQAVGVLEDCTLILVHPDGGHELALDAQVVFAAPEPNPGVGVQLRRFGAAVVERLRGFVAGTTADREASAAAPAQASSSDLPVMSGVSLQPPPTTADAEVAPLEFACAPALDGEEVEEAQDEVDTEGAVAQDSPPDDVQHQPSRIERLRKLNQTEQQKLARSGAMNDRIMLERLYGRNVWEALLANPKLTIPEVATIARKGSVPRPLLEAIVENHTWISAPIVRRALLSNPRVSSEAILKLLRLTPKHELKSIHKTTTYSTTVRDAARKVLDSA